MRPRRTLPALLGLLLLSASALAAPTPNAPSVSFEENRGQLPEAVRYAVRGPAFRLDVTAQGFSLRAPAGTLPVRFRGARSSVAVTGEAQLPGLLNLFQGADPSGWHRGIPRFARVRYGQLYAGIDAVLYDRDGEVEIDFEVAPGTSPDAIRLDFGAADRVEIRDDGRLVAQLGHTPLLALSAPVLYQIEDGRRTPVQGRWRRIGAREVGFEVGHYDASRALVIDPVLLGYSTRLGGSANDDSRRIRVAANGAITVGGTTASSDFAASAAQGQDAFVARFAPSGRVLEWLTLVGGAGDEQAWGLDIDAAGGAAVAGSTTSSDFPATAGAYQDSLSGGTDAFLAVLDSTGAITYATYYGGGQLDGEFDGGVGIHSSGRVYIGSRANTTNLPDENPFSTNCPNAPCAFVAGFDPSLSMGASLVYATYVTGAGAMNEDGGTLDLVVDASENLYVFLFANPGMTIVPAGLGFQDATGDMNNNDHVLVKLDPSLTGAAQLLYATFIGGLGDEDERGGITADDSGIVYVGSRTGSTAPAFPVKNALQATNAGGTDMYVQKIDTTLTGAASQVWGTFLGGSQDEEGRGISFDAAGNVWMVGETLSSDFPLVNPLLGTSAPAGAGLEAVAVQLSSDGQTQRFGSVIAVGRGVAVDASDRALVVGQRNDGQIPLLGGLAPSMIGGQDVGVVRLDPVADQGLTLSASATSDPAATGDTFGFRYLVRNLGEAERTDVTLTTTFPAGLTAALTSANCTVPGASSSCDLFEPLPIGANQPVFLLASAPAPGSFGVSASAAATQVDPTPGDNADATSVDVDALGSASNILELSDFDAVALSNDIGGFALDTPQGVLATSNGSLSDVVNLMTFDGAIDLRIVELLGQGEVAFGFVERNDWTPAAFDGSDLFGRDFNAIPDRVFAIVDYRGRVRLMTAAPFSPGREVAQGFADLARGKTFSLVIDFGASRADVMYEGKVVVSGDPFTADPADADPLEIGDDQVISVGFGTEDRGAAVLTVPEPSGLLAFVLGAGLVAGLRRGRR